MTTPRRHPRTQRHRGAALFAWTGSGLLLAFWALYFTGRLAPERADPILAEFEAAFPVADAVLAVTLVVAGIGLWKGRRAGPYCLTVAAAMAVYLGILDLTFYTRQGLYGSLDQGHAVELVVNLICVAGGGVGLVLGWRLGRYDHVRHAA